MTEMNLLPVGFEALNPFVEFWAVDTAVKRAQCRQISDQKSRAQFYDAAKNLMPDALALLDTKSLHALNDSELRLMKLALSFAHVALAVELQREEESKHAKDRVHMKITQAPADL